MEWLHLPAEIWFHVFSFLPHKRFPRRQLSLVNWRFNEIVQNIPLYSLELFERELQCLKHSAKRHTLKEDMAKLREETYSQMDEFLYVEILMYLIDNDTDKKLAKSFPEIWQSIRVLELSHLFVNDILNHFKRTVFHHDLLSPSLACQNTNHWWRLTQISIMTLVRSHNLALGEVPCVTHAALLYFKEAGMLSTRKF